MSVIVKGMKMPKNCLECEIRSYDANAEEEYCHFIQVECLSIGRQDDCPLVELPEKHGDLIDRKVLSDAVLKWMPSDPCGREEKEFPFEEDICASMMMEIEEQPTVIEAEGE